MTNLLDFELFKNQKELDKDYNEYLGHCNKYFGTDVTPTGIFKRLYFATRYLEGTSNGYRVFSKLGLSDIEYKKGVILFCDWLQQIIDDLKGDL